MAFPICRVLGVGHKQVTKTRFADDKACGAHARAQATRPRPPPPAERHRALGVNGAAGERRTPQAGRACNLPACRATNAACRAQDAGQQEQGAGRKASARRAQGAGAASVRCLVTTLTCKRQNLMHLMCSTLAPQGSTLHKHNLVCAHFTAVGFTRTNV